MKLSWKFCCFALVLCGLSLGCGGGEKVDVATVTGVVTLDNKPLPDATVMFVPDSGRPSVATTDTQGRYTLTYTEGVSGAVVGRNKVIIRTEVPGEDGEPPVVKETLPKKYHDETTLSVEVTPGENKHDFALTST